MAAPAGYVKGEDRLEKDPDQRIQEAVLLVFTKFQEVGSVRQTLLWFLEHDLQLPVKTVDGDTRWKRPQYQTVHRILTNPAYAGAYAYGRTEHSTRYEEGKPRKASRRKARRQWLSLIPNTHEGYITWDQFERVQLAIGENMRGREHSGARSKWLSAIVRSAALPTLRPEAYGALYGARGRDPTLLLYSWDVRHWSAEMHHIRRDRGGRGDTR